MTHFMSKSIVYFFVIIFFQYVLHLTTHLQVNAEGAKCVVVLDDGEKWDKNNKECMESNKFEGSNFGNGLNTTLEEFDFDDNVSLL